MKKFFFLLLMILILAACSDKSNEELDGQSTVEQETEEVVVFEPSKEVELLEGNIDLNYNNTEVSYADGMEYVVQMGIDFDYEDTEHSIFITLYKDGKQIKSQVENKFPILNNTSGVEYRVDKNKIIMGSYASIPTDNGPKAVRTLSRYNINEDGTITLEKSKTLDYESVQNIEFQRTNDMYTIVIDHDEFKETTYFDEEFEEMLSVGKNDFYGANDYAIDYKKQILFVDTEEFYHEDKKTAIFDLNKQDGIWDEDGNAKEFEFTFEDPIIIPFDYEITDKGIYKVERLAKSSSSEVEFIKYEDEGAYVAESYLIESPLKNMGDNYLELSDKEVYIYRFVEYKGKNVLEKNTFNRVDK